MTSGLDVILPRGSGKVVVSSQSNLHLSRRNRCQSDLGKTDRRVTLLSDYKLMGPTTKERVEREKQRRETANERMREKVATARRRGICRCGGKLDKKPGTRRNYSTCPDCREKAKVSATRYYREGPLPPRERPLAKLDGRLRDSTGVRRRLERDDGRRKHRWPHPGCREHQRADLQ